MIFDLKDNKPTITIEAIHIPEFRAIWEEDESPEKVKASGALAYVYHMADYSSSYAQLERKERGKVLREDYIVDGWFPEHLIDAAIEKYKLLTETEMMRLVQSGLATCVKLRTYLDDIDFKERDTQGKPIYVAKDVVTTLKQIGALYTSLEELNEQVKKGKGAKRNIKRNVKPSTILDE